MTAHIIIPCIKDISLQLHTYLGQDSQTWHLFHLLSVSVFPLVLADPPLGRYTEDTYWQLSGPSLTVGYCPAHINIHKYVHLFTKSIVKIDKLK